VQVGGGGVFTLVVGWPYGGWLRAVLIAQTLVAARLAGSSA
jgi:hypothetical protein